MFRREGLDHDQRLKTKQKKKKSGQRYLVEDLAINIVEKRLH